MLKSRKTNTCALAGADFARFKGGFFTDCMLFDVICLVTINSIANY